MILWPTGIWLAADLPEVTALGTMILAGIVALGNGIIYLIIGGAVRILVRGC